jgi:hypothetical protein
MHWERCGSVADSDKLPDVTKQQQVIHSEPVVCVF